MVLHAACADCRKRKAARDRSRKIRARLKAEYESNKRRMEIHAAKKVLATQTDETLVRGMLRALGVEAAKARAKLKFYETRIADGRYTERTVAARNFAEAKVQYYDAVKQLILRDRGALPLRAYFSNTRLLYSHGLRYTFDPDDPDLEGSTYGTAT
jgi:hypothetical protein